MHNSEISIVIITAVGTDALLLLCASLWKQQEKTTTLEIIVVFNQEKVPIFWKKALTQLGCRVTSEAKRGPSHARNKGYVLAKYPHITFLDEDMSVSPDFIKHLLSAWRKYPTAKLMGGKILLSSEMKEKVSKKMWQIYPWLFGYQNYGDKPRVLDVHEPVYSGSMHYRKEKSDSVPFSENLGTIVNGQMIGAEDFELSTRIFLQNKLIMYVPTIQVTHNSVKKYFVLRMFLRQFQGAREIFLAEKLLSQRYQAYAKRSYLSQIVYDLKKNWLSLLFKDPLILAFEIPYLFLALKKKILTGSVFGSNIQSQKQA